jgi:hypothetical protein
MFPFLLFRMGELASSSVELGLSSSSKLGSSSTAARTVQAVAKTASKATFFIISALSRTSVRLRFDDDDAVVAAEVSTFPIVVAGAGVSIPNEEKAFKSAVKRT